jgi:hypothetical protein
MARTGPFALVLILFAALPMAAQQDDRITQLEQKLDELLRQADSIRQELNSIKGTAAPVPEDLTAVEPTAATPPPTAPEQQPAAPEGQTPQLTDVQTVENPSNAGAAKALNPDISVIGTFLSHAGDDFEGRAPAEIDEVELAYEAFIDPYAKGRFFIAISPEGVDVEEGYAQFVTLPWGLTAKAGKTKATFGKANTWHTHVRPWVDQPLMVTRFLGKEGIADVGLSVSKIIDNPFGAFLEATGEVYSGDVEGAFGRGTSNDLLYNAHLKFFRDITENSNVEVGTSWARGTLPEGDGHNRLAGVDVTYRWKPLSRAIYNSLIARVEALSNKRADVDPTLYGYYASLDYQLGQRWFAGVRLDGADTAIESGRSIDRGYSATLTFWPSEFSQLRGQLRRTTLGDGPSFNEFLFQLQFAIGAHGAHVF